MNLVDTSGWIEYFFGEANATYFTPPIDAALWTQDDHFSQLSGVNYTPAGICEGDDGHIMLDGQTGEKQAAFQKHRTPSSDAAAADTCASPEEGKRATICLDADPMNADWPKRTWDLPPYKSEEFMRLCPDLDAFRQLPVYKFAVANGLIRDDEWLGGGD